MGAIQPPIAPPLLISGPSIIIPKHPALTPSASRWKRDAVIQDMIDYFDEDGYRDQWDILSANPGELAAVQNEVLKCQEDFVYAARNYFWIVDTERRDIPLLLNEPQELILGEMLSMKAQGLAQKLLILKSRQLGCSTLIEALVAWRTMFFPNTTAYVISHTKSAAQELFAKMTKILDMMPWWLQPMTAKRTYDEGLIFDNPAPGQRREYPGLNSRVNVGSQATGCIGRGDTISALHLSEFCFFQQDLCRDIIEGDLKAAMHDNPQTFGFLESTGKGAGSYSHDLWRKNKRLAERADFRTLFIPWFFDKKHFLAPRNGWAIQPQESKMRERVVSEWVKCDNSECGRYHESFRQGEHTSGLTCPHCRRGKLQPFWLEDGQMCWMEKRRVNADGLEEIKKLRSEQCTTDEEAWIVSGVQIFPDDVMQKAAACIRPPLAIGNLDKVGKFHGVRRIYRNEEGFELGSECWEPSCTADHRSDDTPLSIWEFPDPRYTYSIGADVAEGIGQDFSVACVNRVGEGPNADVQVALFRSNTIGAIDFASPLDLLGRMYNEAMIACEYNIYTSCADELRLRKSYPNLYRWKHLDSVSGMQSNKWHWYTNYKSKSKLWQTGVKRLRSGDFVPRSQNLIEEMKTFTKDDFDSQSASANRGFYDDEIMATLITVYTAHETDFDENLGYIPSKNKTANGLQGDAAWVMRCPRCKATWEWESPTQDQGCPACRYALIEGSRKDVFQGVGGAAVYDTLITEMIEKQVDDNTASSYDRY